MRFRLILTGIENLKIAKAIALVFFGILSLFKGAHKSNVQRLQGATIVAGCWPFKVVLECVISRQGYISLGEFIDHKSSYQIYLNCY